MAGVIKADIGHIIGSPHDMFCRPAHASAGTVAAGEGIRALNVLSDSHHLRTPESEFVSPWGG